MPIIADRASYWDHYACAPQAWRARCVRWSASAISGTARSACADPVE